MDRKKPIIYYVWTIQSDTMSQLTKGQCKYIIKLYTALKKIKKQLCSCHPSQTMLLSVALFSPVFAAWPCSYWSNLMLTVITQNISFSTLLACKPVDFEAERSYSGTSQLSSDYKWEGWALLKFETIGSDFTQSHHNSKLQKANVVHMLDVTHLPPPFIDWLGWN